MEVQRHRPHLVVLDGHTTDPGDLSWERLEQMGELTVHARTAPEQVAARIARAHVVLTNRTPLTAPLIDGAPALIGICVLATGHGVAARRSGQRFSG